MLIVAYKSDTKLPVRYKLKGDFSDTTAFKRYAFKTSNEHKAWFRIMLCRIGLLCRGACCHKYRIGFYPRCAAMWHGVTGECDIF